MFVSIGEISDFIGVSTSTMRRWEREGRLQPCFRTKGGHRRYGVNKVKESLGLLSEKIKRKVFAYARVSSHDQKDDLTRQVNRLDDYCTKEFGAESYEIIKDLGSGLNYKKRGLKKLLREILSGKVSEVILTHKDRLLRFGSEIIFLICSAFGTEVRMIEEETIKTDEEALAKDVLEIITVFAARMYGKRAHKNRSKLDSDHTNNTRS